MALRILVCGGRDYADREAVYRVLDRVHAERGIALVIHGAARGADTLADNWAKARGIKPLPFPVTDGDWHRLGRSAGPIRNARMLAEGKPDACVAFPPGPRGEKSGTANMIRQAEAAGVTVWQPVKE